MAPPITVPGPARTRRATLADLPALIRLRLLMLGSMGIQPHRDREAEWFAATETWFADRLSVPGSAEFAAFIAEDPELGPVGCAAGVCLPHAPGPVNISGLHGHVFNVCTDPRRRRLGLARDCLTALLDWFSHDTQARVIDLNATPDGEALYRSLGFTEPRDRALQLRLNPT